MDGPHRDLEHIVPDSAVGVYRDGLGRGVIVWFLLERVTLSGAPEHDRVASTVGEPDAAHLGHQPLIRFRGGYVLGKRYGGFAGHVAQPDHLVLPAEEDVDPLSPALVGEHGHQAVAPVRVVQGLLQDGVPLTGYVADDHRNTPMRESAAFPNHPTTCSGMNSPISRDATARTTNGM